MIDEFEEIIKDIKIEKQNTKFKLYNLELKHFYFNDGDEIDKPIYVSIKIKNRFDKWYKTITYYYRNHTKTKTININEEIINKLELIDLRELKNNYYTDTKPNNFSHYEIIYNNIFKIVGTYDNEIKEYKQISKLLDFKNIINNI